MDTIPTISEQSNTNLTNSSDNTLHLGLASEIHTGKRQDGSDPLLSLSMNQEDNNTQSVIQPNQQSVIQTAPNTHNIAQGGEKAIRREILSRRPSYRRILNELSESPHQVGFHNNSGVKMEVVAEVKTEDDEIENDQNITYQTSSGTVTIQQAPQTIQITAPLSQNSDQNNVSGMQTFAVANALSQGQIIQQSDAGNTIWMPGGHVVVQGSGGDMQTYQIRSPSANIPSAVVTSNNIQSPQQMAEEASRKRELRLLKNREAARDCRRKKKEYIKCLENRVHVLETQNKALIDELKTLKEMYCSKDGM